MEIDAVALFRPRRPASLEPYLDLDEDSEQSTGLYAEKLDDGAVLIHTFQEYATFEENPAEGRAWLAQFGDDLGDVHDDPRGVLFFPDRCEPEGRTYDAVVAEVESQGLWVPAAALTAEEQASRDEQGEPPLEEAGRPEVDFGSLQALTEQLLGGLNLGSVQTPEEATRVLAELQQRIMGALGASGEEPLHDEFVDEEKDE